MSESKKVYHYMEKKGAIGIPLVNDAFFHLLMQRCEPALKGIISGVLKIDRDSITKVQILNPIEVGEQYGDKEMVLDILVIINDEKYINIEMQVVNKHDWVERTLNYIYRVDDDLKKGSPYTDLKEIYQIGIMNYTLFPAYPEFCSTYKIMNVNENHNIYTDKLQINVIDLTNIDLASEEDKAAELDKWARFFKIEKWEELQMLAQENVDIKEASEVVYNFTENDHIKKYLEQRAMFDKISLETLPQRLEAENARLEVANKQLKTTNTQLKIANTELETQNTQLTETLEKRDEEIEKYKQLLKEKGIKIK